MTPDMSEILKKFPGGVMPRKAAPTASSPLPPGVLVPEDSPIYTAFRKLEQQSTHRERISLESNDPRMAKMAAAGSGFAPMEKSVLGPDTRMVVMHMKMPATDVPNTIDDWEIRALVKGGRTARLITSPAVPRIMKLGEQMLQMQMAMYQRQAALAMKNALASGPGGLVQAGLIAGGVAMAYVGAASVQKKAADFFSWQCEPAPAGATSAAKSELTDERVIGEGDIDGVAVRTYEFYVHEGDRYHGPVRMHVVRDSGLPLRIEITDPQGRGTVKMDYSGFNESVQFDAPACLADR
jgi:hypothetical protein